ncbi:hypothetical protein DFA_10685 [Cavenderia fasciculata]|uniref:PiggyBac transposable element-derived protein domain-containing protein n=1 Tax=Cavenderia fasciculata TaxID=261658 RepID=F4QB40_CACFS|nr:uncharacterized protein DFA_10685 [Cavenderia fasciculata]EGG14812.1 hypothetical protein DFA_10685 [Cavenderia fasciculata]|eukprot:XP_004351328.1 hypothetical protein DFA_10685 [Cavenderia fasciculata]
MAKPSKNKGQKEVEINENLSDGEEEIGESIVEMEEGREGKILIAFEWLQTNLTYLNWINRVYFRDVTGYECGKVEANHGGDSSENDWVKIGFSTHTKTFKNYQAGYCGKNKPTSIIQTFSKMFDESIYQLIIDQTNIYMKQKGLDKAFKSLFHSYMTKEILNTFFSITLEMGRVDMPSIADYWRSDGKGQAVCKKSKFLREE